MTLIDMALLSILKHLCLGELATMLEYSNLLALVIVGLLGLLSLKLVFNGKGGKLKLPPSPPRLPIIGNLHQLGNLPHQSLHALSKKYGPVMLLQLGHIPTVVISSDKAASEMLKDNDMIFLNRPQQKAVKIFLDGPKDMAFTPYGDYWRHMRKVSVLELLSLKRVKSFQYVREEEVGVMIKKISQECSPGVPVNISEFLLSLTNSISCRCILGRKCEEEDGTNKFAMLAKKTIVQLMEFSFHDYFPSFEWLDVCTGLIARLKKTSREINVFVDQAIEEHMLKLQDDDKSNKSDFIDILLKLQRDGMSGFEFTKDHLRVILLDMIVAGTDTTFATMEWAISETVRHPNIMRKLQEEVRRVVGTKSKIDENDMSQMEYLKCVLKETLRLHPPLTLSVPREASSSVKIGGYDIPAKTRVLVNLWGIHRDSSKWDRAEEFIPERFQNFSVESKGQDFHYIPFSAGRRGCPGMTFGTSTSEYALANLMYWFDWKLPGNISENELDMTDGDGLSTPRKTPLCLLPTLYSP